jgi:hypothetical protein
MNTGAIKTGYEYAQLHGGVTFNGFELNPDLGYMVSFPGLELKLNINEFSLRALERFVSENLPILESVSNSFVGVWLNPDDNCYYLDISEQLFDKEHALRTGMLRDQLAIFDLSEGKTINLPSRQKTGTEYQQKTYINQVVRGLL